MTPKGNIFTVHETHGILLQDGHEIWQSSDNLRWSSLYASIQREYPYESYFEGVDDHLIILHLDGPVRVRRVLGSGETSRVIPPGGMFMMPGSMDFGVGLGEGLQTIHLYVRRALIREVAADLMAGDPVHLELLPRFGDTDPVIESLMLAIRDVVREGDPAA